MLVTMHNVDKQRRSTFYFSCWLCTSNCL